MKAIIIFTTSVVLSSYLWSVNAGSSTTNTPSARTSSARTLSTSTLSISTPSISALNGHTVTHVNVKSVNSISVMDDKNSQQIVVEYNVERLKLKLKMQREAQGDYSFRAEFGFAESVYEKINELTSIDLNLGSVIRNALRN